MADLYPPFGLGMLPPMAWRYGGVPDTLTGAETELPPPTTAPIGRKLRQAVYGVMTPFGPPSGPPSMAWQPVPSLTGREVAMTPVPSADFRPESGEDVASQEVGRMLAGGPLMHGAAGLGRMAAASAPGRYLLNTVMPRVAPAAFGTAALTVPVGAERRQQPSDQIKDLQRKLQAQGLYTGPIDGVLEPGGPTQRALDAYNDKLAKDAKQRQSDQAAELAKAKSENERRALELQQAKENRAAEESTRAAKLAAEGAGALGQLQPTFMEEWGPYLGYGLGLGLGGGARYGIGRLLGREQIETGRRAAALAGDMGQGELPERVARVNQFWAEGAPNSAPPFGFQPQRTPFPWQTDPAAAAPNQLFAPPRGLAGAGANYGPAALTLGGGIAEMGVGQSWLSSARKDLQDAEDAVSQPNGTTPANVRRLAEARAKVAQGEFMLRMGMGTVSGGALGEFENRITRSRLKPSVMAADAERGRVDQLLNPPAPPAPPAPPGPRPVFDPVVNRWRLNGGFVRKP